MSCNVVAIVRTTFSQSNQFSLRVNLFELSIINNKNMKMALHELI